jgi:hypothetical protein
LVNQSPHISEGTHATNPKLNISTRSFIASHRIRVVGCTYLVDFGPSTQPSFHTVKKHRSCSCQLKETYPAIEAVAEYLRNGGQRASDPMPPCPFCGAETVRDRKWDGKYTRELGWRCTTRGLRHFLEAKSERIKEALRQQSACQKSGKLAAVSVHEIAAGR